MRFAVTAVWLVVVVAAGHAGPAAEEVFFQDKVLPILQRHCYACHSHASGKIKGGLALDSRRGWEQGGDSGPAIKPRLPHESLLIRAVRHENPELKMPPKDKLSAAEIGLLVDWVTRGAADPRVASGPAAATDWWAVRPLAQPKPPDAGVHPIDAFIRARLREKGLTPAIEADRRGLIRRLTFDLHGLPPTPEEVEAFVKDRDPRAYETLVDRLLASPRHGERMARLWLDVVHYGESNGYGMDRPRLNAWPYRDYVIHSFNDDKPYARFVAEQLAADALYPDQPGLTPALGFIAAGPFNQSALVEQVNGTRCWKIALNLDRDDMVSSVAASFLSVTLHCARCHDHKFDPITMRDYYRMQAVFAGVRRGEREFDVDPAVAAQRRRWLEVRRRLDSGGPFTDLDLADRAELTRGILAAETALLEAEKQWQVLDVTALSQLGTPTVVPLPDRSLRFAGPAADKDTYVLTATTSLESIGALRLEVLTDDTLPQRGPGRQPQNGNLHLSEVQVSAAPAATADKTTSIKISKAFADVSLADYEISRAIDGQPGTAWRVHPQEGQSHQAVFVFERPIAHKQGSVLTVLLSQLQGSQHLIGRLRLSASSRAPVQASVVSPDVVALISVPAHLRSTDEQARTAAGLARLLADQRLAALPALHKVFAVGSELPVVRNYRLSSQPESIHVLRRGDVSKPLEEVQPGALAAVTAVPAELASPGAGDEAARRAALARWIADGRNPLTWRSIANRVWLWHFERGLVETPNDFGRMGAPPSHPELLDWLACELRDHGGSLKRLHRLIVTSATYKQTAHADAVAFKIDGDNRLLGRMTPRRLDAEQLRDALLAVSGKLDLTMGGPPAMQFAYRDSNVNVAPLIDYESFDPDQPASYRRGVYRFLFRNVNDPLLDAFDAANPSLSTPQRTATITPLQALSLFNNRFVLRQCEHLAARLERAAPDVPGRIDRAYRLLYARPPAADEAVLLADFARQHGLAQACRVLVNANEFLFLP